MSNAEMMTIDVLTGSDVVTVDDDATLVDVATALTGADIGAVVLGSKDNVRGVVSERDLVRAAAERLDFETTAASTVASTTLVWADSTASVGDVAEQMMERWVRHVLIEDDGVLVGIVSARDVLGVLTGQTSDD